MQNVTEDNITDTFLNYFGKDTDPRVLEIMSSLARHLHDFARETRITHAEWQQGLEFLRATGRITTPKRDEFVLLSDVLGLSSLVDMMHSPAVGTSSSVLGPFHVSNPPAHDLGSDLRGEFDGEVVLVKGRILDVDNKPVSGATIDIWQTAPNGMYSSQDPDQDDLNFHAKFTTDKDGNYSFTTVKPVPYTVPTDGPVGDILKATGRHPWRPSHLHYIVEAEGFRSLVTEVFPSDDEYLNHDTVFGVRDDLIMHYLPQPAGSFPEAGFELSGSVKEPWLLVEFDIVLVAASSI
ncbi:dioxygenase [Granulosicoccus antarcticus]|uniref:Hydroxyquinol 1,2-dioxygenase n=1 Tax=Granulosicoccus antarcticus IMCC3135 TaxID=1192854 RepID=A0A2Z2NXE4_9GAMM|nr:dioxygenase [Granulosicoccus antarcticus]ASJ76116.1 Hydroxyquinol 1,2-dioxygenase [Granulosicoccus antarcticus IMCC3135]